MSSAKNNNEVLSEYCEEMRVKLDLFQKHAQTYAFVAKKQVLPVEPDTKDIDEAHDHYLKTIYNLQLKKLSTLGCVIVEAAKFGNAMNYSLACRSLLEHVAVWHYFLVHRYAPLFPNNQMSDDEYFDAFRGLVRAHREFLYGSRFDWQLWLSDDKTALERVYLDRLSEKKRKSKKKTSSPEIEAMKSVNVLTCIEKLSASDPMFGVNYEMFCDMVHPNIGSNIFLCGLSQSGVISVDEKSHINLGIKFIERSFEALADLTYGRVNELTKSHFSFLVCESPPPSFAIKFGQ